MWHVDQGRGGAETGEQLEAWSRQMTVCLIRLAPEQVKKWVQT